MAHGAVIRGIFGRELPTAVRWSVFRFQLPFRQGLLEFAANSRPQRGLAVQPARQAKLDTKSETTNARPLFYQEEYAVPSCEVRLEALCTSTMPGSVWSTAMVESSWSVVQLDSPVKGSLGICFM